MFDADWRLETKYNVAAGEHSQKGDLKEREREIQVRLVFYTL